MKTRSNEFSPEKLVKLSEKLLLNTIMLEKTRWAAEKRPHPDLLDLLPRIAGLTGFRRIEVWQYHISGKSVSEMEKLRGAAEKLGLSFAVVGAYPIINRAGKEKEEQLQRLRHTLECAHQLGADLVKFFAGGVSTRDASETDWLASVQFLQEVLDDAAGMNLAMTVEAHANTLGDCVPSLRRLLESVQRPHLKICFQPFQFDSLDETLRDFNLLKADITHIHLQNRKGSEMSLLAEGQLDYRAYLTHVRESGFQGYLCLEFTKDIIQRGEFDRDRVLKNAEIDRQFIAEVWNASE